MILAFPVVVQESHSHRIHAAFTSGKHALLAKLESTQAKIKNLLEIHEKTGDELLLAVDYPAKKIKDLTTDIEETHPVGRLFDLDVIDINGQKLSRPSFRKCIICRCQAQECARTRKHSVNEMQSKIEEMLMEFDCQKNG